MRLGTPCNYKKKMSYKVTSSVYSYIGLMPTKKLNILMYVNYNSIAVSTETAKILCYGFTADEGGLTIFNTRICDEVQ